jgi:hypothetical protein
MLEPIPVSRENEPSMDNEEPASAMSTGDDIDGGGFRALVETLLDYTGASAFDEVLMPWLDARHDELAWLASFAGRAGAPVPPASVEERWRLYALSRLCELLRQAAYTRRPPFRLTEGQFHVFVERLGLDASVPAAYAPFHHEVVHVLAAADPHQAPSVIGADWPCLMLGDLLLMRAGVSVEAGNEVLRAGIADAATLYWTCERAARPTHDLAHGWGSNSAWRTAFRRDYQLGDAFHFNVDGAVDLARLAPDACDESGLTRAERIELLVHRSFVTATRPHVDLFPYDDRLALPVRPAADPPGPRWWNTIFR